LSRGYEEGQRVGNGAVTFCVEQEVYEHEGKQLRHLAMKGILFPRMYTISTRYDTRSRDLDLRQMVLEKGYMHVFLTPQSLVSFAGSP
jgi:hypothetical protein